LPEIEESFALDFQNTFGMLLVGFDARFHFVEDAFIHHELAILGYFNFESVHGPGSRPLEIHTALVIAASMARTLEFILCRQPAGRTSEMSAFGKNGVDAFVFPYDPDPELLNIFVAHFSKRVVRRKPSLER